MTPRSFGMREALTRVEEHGDLFEPVPAGGQALGRALKKHARLTAIRQLGRGRHSTATAPPA